MDELVKSTVSFLEYMILGALALGLGVVPWWKSQDGKNTRAKITHFFCQCGLAIPQTFALIVLASLLYFIGVIVNCATIWLFQPSHFYVIRQAGQLIQLPTNNISDTISNSTNSPKAITEAISTNGNFPTCKLEFLILPLLRHRTRHEEFTSFTIDYSRQVKWTEENKSSYTETLGGLEKKLKLLRGSVLLLPVWAIFWVWWLFRRRRLIWRFFFCLLAYVFFYLFLMHCLWTAEMEGHTEVILHSSSSNLPASLKLSFESDGLKLQDINQPTKK